MSGNAFTACGVGVAGAGGRWRPRARWPRRRWRRPASLWHCTTRAQSTLHGCLQITSSHTGIGHSLSHTHPCWTQPRCTSF